MTFLNRVAETLTGWSHAEAISRPLAQVFRLMSEATREPMECAIPSRRYATGSTCCRARGWTPPCAITPRR